MEVWCAIITGVAAIICAAIGVVVKGIDSRSAEQSNRAEERAAQRAKEGQLQLAMINANCQLTVGVAMALKNGHCNGEVEEGLKAVRETTEEYKNFLEGIAIEKLSA